MPIYLSANFTTDDFPLPWSEDQMLTIFQDRVTTWTLNIAHDLIENNQHAGYASLSIILSYFEMIGKYQAGYVKDLVALLRYRRNPSGKKYVPGMSNKHFKEGVDSVFSLLKWPRTDMRPEYV